MLRTSRRLAALTSVALLGALAYPGGSVAWAASTVDQAQDATPGSAYPISAAESAAQTFTVGRTGALDQVAVQVLKDENQDNDDVLTATIRTLSGDPAQPDESVLATASVVAEDMPAGMEWNTLSLESPLPVVAGQQYALVVSSDADPFERIAWGYVDSSGYTAGSAYAPDSFGAWVQQENRDMNFRTYVDPGSDADGDGFGAFQECDDTDVAVNPAATEVYNQVDDDCDGTVDEGFSAPGPPGIGSATSGAVGGAVNATARWTRPLTNGGLPVTGYKVQALKLNATGGIASRVTRTTGAAARSLVVKLAAGRYRFRVAAVNAEGQSPWSASSTIVKAR